MSVSSEKRLSGDRDRGPVTGIGGSLDQLVESLCRHARDALGKPYRWPTALPLREVTAC